MGISDLEIFNEIARKCGNRYLAVTFLANAARRLGEANSVYRISESHLMQWVLTGKCPFTQSELELRKMVSEDVDNINEYLSYVDDDFIREKVTNFYKLSIKRKNLTYCTDRSISPGIRSRINILLRMIWYRFKIL